MTSGAWWAVCLGCLVFGLFFILGDLMFITEEDSAAEKRHRKNYDCYGRWWQSPCTRASVVAITKGWEARLIHYAQIVLSLHHGLCELNRAGRSYSLSNTELLQKPAVKYALRQKTGAYLASIYFKESFDRWLLPYRTQRCCFLYIKKNHV